MSLLHYNTLAILLVFQAHLAAMQIRTLREIATEKTANLLANLENTQKQNPAFSDRLKCIPQELKEHCALACLEQSHYKAPIKDIINQLGLPNITNQHTNPTSPLETFTKDLTSMLTEIQDQYPKLTDLTNKKYPQFQYALAKCTDQALYSDVANAIDAELALNYIQEFITQHQSFKISCSGTFLAYLQKTHLLKKLSPLHDQKNKTLDSQKAEHWVLLIGDIIKMGDPKLLQFFFDERQDDILTLCSMPEYFVQICEMASLYECIPSIDLATIDLTKPIDVTMLKSSGCFDVIINFFLKHNLADYETLIQYLWCIPFMHVPTTGENHDVQDPTVRQILDNCYKILEYSAHDIVKAKMTKLRLLPQ